MAKGRRLNFKISAVLVAACGLAHGASAAETSKFSVTRNGDPIGTSAIEIVRNGDQTTVTDVTHVAVTIAFVTVYKFDQTETEKWSAGKLVSMDALTDDDGTLHKTSACGSGDGGLLVQDGDQKKKIAMALIPASVWSPAILEQTAALDPLDGTMVKVSVVNRGEENLVIKGHETHTRHFSVTTGYSQDVWYDDNNRLVRIELKGRDGSNLRYELD